MRQILILQKSCTGITIRMSTLILYLSPQMKKFIEQNGPVKVSVVKGRYPICYEQDGEDKGAALTSMELIAGRTGLTFEFVHADNYEQAIEMVKDGRADIFNGFMESEYSAQELEVIRTASYASLEFCDFKE